MSDDAGSVNPTIAAQTTKNLALAGRFLREALANPSIIEAIPNEASVVLLPHDDPDLARTNFTQAAAMVERGQEVRFRLVGGPIPKAERWRAVDRRDITFREIAPRWATDLDPADLRVVYDRQRDVLLIDLAAGRRSGTAMPINASTLALVDIDAEEAFGYLVPSFLTHAIRRVPRLAMILGAAELRPLTDDELGGMNVGGTGGAEIATLEEAGPMSPLSPGSAGALLDDIQHLIA